MVLFRVDASSCVTATRYSSLNAPPGLLFLLLVRPDRGSVHAASWPSMLETLLFATLALGLILLALLSLAEGGETGERDNSKGPWLPPN